MAFLAEIVIRHRGCVSERFHGATTLAQLSGDKRGDRRAELFVLHAPDDRTLARALRWCSEYVDNRADVVARAPGSLVFRGINSPAGTVEAIRKSACSILWPVVYRDGLEYFRVLAPRREDLRRLMDDLKPHGPAVLRSLGPVGADTLESTAPLASLTQTITAAQLAAFRAALSSGYYDIPRRARLADLARGRRVGASTFAEHLRKAERALLAKFGEWITEAETIGRASAKGRGRPRRRP